MMRKTFSGVLFTLCIAMVLIIISLHLDDRIDSSSRNRSETQLCLPPVHMTNSQTLRRLHHPSTQYIWCVNHYGPNNQLRDFVKCCIIAMLSNYTLIIPPLYPHYGDQTKGIQWFNHFYDLKELSRILNFVTLDQFIPSKLNQKKVLIDCFLRQVELVQGRGWYSQNTLGSIQNHYKVHLVFQHHINLTRNFNLNELWLKGKTCSSMFLHIHYTTFGQFFSSPNIYTQSIFQHLRRNALIQRMTSELIKFLPQLVINNNRSRTHLTTLAVIHMRLGDHTVMSVSMYIQQIMSLLKSGVRFTHLHIMCPYLNSTDIQNLTENLPIAFTTTQHLLTHLRFVLDEYLFGVFEQEIAYQAAIFLASPWTTYSATVLMQKIHQAKGIVYVLSAKGKIPPLLVTKKNVKYFK